jgi:hypothetical protein
MVLLPEENPQTGIQLVYGTGSRYRRPEPFTPVTKTAAHRTCDLES